MCICVCAEYMHIVSIIWIYWQHLTMQRDLCVLTNNANCAIPDMPNCFMWSVDKMRKIQTPKVPIAKFCLIPTCAQSDFGFYSPQDFANCIFNI